MAQTPTVTSHAIRSSGTAVFSGSGMPAILTPALALRHLRELSTDVRAAVALTPAGEPIAGDAAIAASARAFVTLADEAAREGARPGEAAPLAVATDGGAVLLARTADAAFVVVAGPHVLLDLLRHDLGTLVDDTREDAAAAITTTGGAVVERAMGEVGAGSVPRSGAAHTPGVGARTRLETAAKALIGAAGGNFHN